MSTVILELKTVLVFDTPQGKAEAYFMADYGFDADTLWGCFIRKTRQFWWFHNKDIKIEQNITIGRIREESERVPLEVNPNKIYPNSAVDAYPGGQLQNGKSEIKSRESKSIKSNARVGSR